MSQADDDLFADLEGIFDEVNEDDYEVLAFLSDFDLLERYHLNNMELKERGELYADNGDKFGSSTMEGRTLQSKRAAYLIEIRLRGLPL